MPRYLIPWKANASAWPTDPKQILAILEGAVAGGEQLIKSGGVEINWLGPQEGFAIIEAASKEVAMGMVQGFFPFYTRDVREFVPWEAGKKAILDSARQTAR